MTHTDTDLSSPAATSLDLSVVIPITVTDARFDKESNFWLLAIENILMVLS